jgi:serine protease inhibitor ecotin
MKKKIAALLKDGSLKGNAEYESLLKAQQLAKRALERAKKEKSEAQTVCQEALAQGKKDQDGLLELLTAYRQAKCMRQYHRAGHKLAKHRLHSWLENYLKTAEVPHEPAKAKAAKTFKSKKTVPAKVGNAKMANKVKTPKVAGKNIGRPAQKAG